MRLSSLCVGGEFLAAGQAGRPIARARAARMRGTTAGRARTDGPSSRSKPAARTAAQTAPRTTYRRGRSCVAAESRARPAARQQSRLLPVRATAAPAPAKRRRIVGRVRHVTQVPRIKSEESGRVAGDGILMALTTDSFAMRYEAVGRSPRAMPDDAAAVSIQISSPTVRLAEQNLVVGEAVAT